MVATQEKTREKKKLPDELFLKLALPNSGFTDDEFFDFCQLNENFKIERNSKQELIIMALTGGKTGNRNFKLYRPFDDWNEAKEAGECFDSSTGFKLPNGAIYSPDLAWVANERWKAISEEQQEKFVSLCPDFVLELRSPSQTLEYQESKMMEFMENGCRLGWLVDPVERMTHVYRPKVETEKVPFDQPLFGGQVLQGFQLRLSDLKPFR